MRTVIAAIVWLLSTMTVLAQGANVDHWFGYIAINPDETKVVKIFNESEQYIFHIAIDECLNVNVSQDLITTRQQSGPILVRRIATGEAITTIPWKSRWGNHCEIYVGNRANKLTIIVGNGLRGWLEAIDLASGNTLFSYNLDDESERQRYLSNSIDESRDILTLPSSYLQHHILRSPTNPEIAIVVQCYGYTDEAVSTNHGYTCMDLSRVTILNVANQQKIAELEDGFTFETGQYYPGTFAAIYNWSSDGRYIAYVVRPSLSSILGAIRIFDLETLQYIDTTATIAAGTQADFAIQWSRTSFTELAFASRNGEGFIQINTLDFMTDQQQTIVLPGEYREFRWAPNGERLVVYLRNGQLLEFDRTGRSTLLAENVIALFPR